MHTYTLGTGTEPIRLSVDISTLALAASRVLLVDLNSTSPGVSLALSADASGDILLTDIGLPETLRNKRLSIFTKVDITGSDPVERKKEFDGIQATCVISNGAGGEVTFSDPQKTVDDNYLSAMVIQLIDLI
jgi:hypothetical protein